MPNLNSNPNSPSDQPRRIIRCDRLYFNTMPGLLKIAQISCNIIGFICIKISSVWIASIFYNFLYWFATIISALLFLMYTLHIVEKFHKWPWHKVEFFYCAGISVTYLGCAIFAATVGESGSYAVAFFGFCAIIAYGFDAYLKYKGWQRGLPPQ